MNYYEELAVAEDASLEEIRQAYRVLARLLHPDNQPDHRLKSAAERQMVRLNEILATLADPEKRRKYDENLCKQFALREAVLPPPPAPTRLLRRQWPWILACCILLCVGLWYLDSNESGGHSADRGPAPASGRSAQPNQIAPPESTSVKAGGRPLNENRPPKSPLARPKAPPPKNFNPAGNAEPAQAANQLPDASESLAAVAGEATETAPPLVQAHQTAPEAPAQSHLTTERPAAPAFAGQWFYAPGAQNAQTPGMYPPEFIEFFLSEDRGVLSGKYWARYRIPDKPISPEVQFRVFGALEKRNTTTLNWMSEDGAKGQLKIALRDSDSIEVTWWTTAFGRQTALTSGTAVLVRQQRR
ncbi:MAG: DnaJ domain-containing protein [Bryobacteraceae bacterium]|jgi:curved DNA-binding protein CbpA